jgi:hypothetical protein
VDVIASLTDAIIERHQRYGWSSPEGEWGAIQREDRADFKKALDSGNADELEAQLEDLLVGPLSYGLVSHGESRSQVPHMVMWRLAMWAKMTTDPNVECLRVPSVGNPVTFSVAAADGSALPIMIDTPRFDIYAQRMAKALWNRWGGAYFGGTVLEIGSGYGGVAKQLHVRCPGVRVVLCDLPETLYLAWYWLMQVFGENATVAWWDENPDADVVLVPAHELEQAGIEPHLVFSAHALSGMPKATIAHYMAWIAQSTALAFYHDDATVAAPGMWMNDRFPEVLSSAMQPDGFRLTWQEKTPWTGVTDRFSEFFYERVAA